MGVCAAAGDILLCDILHTYIPIDNTQDGIIYDLSVHLCQVLFVLDVHDT